MNANYEVLTEHGIQLSGLANVNESLQTHYLIYKIQNIINDKYYIGQHKTTNIYDSYMGSGFLIKNAIKKYGPTNFIKIILFDFDNFEDMNNKEKELVPLSACYPNNPLSYNLKEGGFSGELSEETKEKMRQNNIGSNNPMYGKDWRDGKTKQEILLHHQHVKEAYWNKPEEKRQEFKQKCKERKPHTGINPYHDKTKEELLIIKQRKQQTWKNKPKEELEIYSQQLSEQRKNYSKEKKNEIKIKKQNTWKNKNKNELKQLKDNMRKKVSGKNNGMYGVHRLGEKAPCFGRKIMHNNDGNKFVKKDEIQKYLALGYKFGKKK